MDGGEGKGREYVCGDTRVCGCDEGSAGAVADVGDAGTGCFVEKMEETENGYCRVKLANGISGFVPEVALRKRLDSDRFLWGKSEERFFVEQGIPEGWSEEVSEEGCGVCEGVSWMPVPVGQEGGGWD